MLLISGLFLGINANINCMEKAGHSKEHDSWILELDQVNEKLDKNKRDTSRLTEEAAYTKRFQSESFEYEFKNLVARYLRDNGLYNIEKYDRLCRERPDFLLRPLKGLTTRYAENLISMQEEARALDLKGSRLEDLKQSLEDLIETHDAAESDLEIDMPCVDLARKALDLPVVVDGGPREALGLILG